MVWGSVYFNQSEFACKDGCGFGSKEEHIEPDLVHILHVLRVHFAVPFRLTSAARCAVHNANEGGKARSTHLAGVQGDCEPRYTGKCRAVDISTAAWTDFQRGHLVELALALGCRVGTASNFIHLDVETPKYFPVRQWTYGAKTSGD